MPPKANDRRLICRGGGLQHVSVRAPRTAQKKPSSPDFERNIAPVFKQSCAACHSGTTPQGELDLTSLQGALKGGKSGKSIVPGSSGQSPLVEKIVSGTMPPGKTKLEEKDISLIRALIDAGAGSEAGGTKASTAAALTENEGFRSSRCAACSATEAQAGRRGLDLRTQAGRLKGAGVGPRIRTR